MKYFSMFSGIGGFEYGIKQTFYNRFNTKTFSKDDRPKHSLNRSDGEGWGSCSNVGYSEIDKYAIQIYEKHFKHKNYGDATKLNTQQLPDFDLLVGGFPCQAFSIAGKRKGFNDTRGTLFFEIARVLADKRPRYFMLENVKGLLSHDEGKTFQTILGVLTDLGYEYQWQVLNSKNFGVPQNRERVFIVGHLRGESRPKVFPIGNSMRENNESGKRQTSGCINAGEGKVQNSNTFIIKQLNQPKHSNDRIYGEEGISPSLNTMQGGRRQPKIVASRGRNPANPSDRTTGSPTEQRLEINEQGITNTLTNVQKDNWVLNDMKIRRLTPTECERLQGFPDGWTEGISDTQRYKCLGNAVTTNVVQAVMERLL